MKKDKPGDEQDYQNILKMKDIKSLKMDYEAERNWKKEGSGAAGGGGGGGERKQSSWISERVKYLPATSSHMDDVSDGQRSSRSESGPSEDEPQSQVRRTT